MMRRFALILTTSFVLVFSAHAQDGYPLPDDLPVITPDNAAQLTELASIGGTLPGGLAWSPGGEHLAVGTSENVQVFDSKNLDATPVVIPAGDIWGNLYFDHDGHIQFNNRDDAGTWDIQTGERISPTQPLATPSPHTQHYVSPDGKIEAVPEFMDGQLVIHLVDPRTTPPKKIADLKTELDADFLGLTFSPDGQKLALGTNMHDPNYQNYPAPAMQLWEIPSRKRLNQLRVSYGVISVMVFSDDSRMFMSIQTDPQWEGLIAFGSMTIWDTTSGESITGKNIPSPSDFVSGGGGIAVRDYGDIGLWTGRDYIHLPVSECLGESENNALLDFSPRSFLITGVGCGEQVQLWDVTREIDPDHPTVIFDTENPIGRLSFSPDETRVVVNDDSGDEQVWDAHTGKKLMDLEGEGGGVQFRANGSLLDGYDSQGNHILWDADTGKRIISLPKNALINTDWSQAAYWLDTSSVRVIDIQTGDATDLKLIDDYVGRLNGFNASTGTAIFTNQVTRGYDMQTGDVVWRLDKGIFSDFSQDGKYFLTKYRSDDGKVIGEVWETADPAQPLHHFEMPPARNPLFTADGKYFSDLDGACGDGGGGAYHLWDAATGEELMNLYPGGACGPYTHTFSPDLKWVAVGWDYNVDILNIADSIQAAAQDEYRSLGAVFTTLSSNVLHTKITGLTISPDGEHLAVSMTYSDWENSPQYDSPIVTYRVSIFNFPALIDQGDAHDSYRNMYTEPHVEIDGAQKAMFIPDSAYLLTEFGLYDAKTGEELALLENNTANFSPDSQTLATVTTDGIQLWDVAALAKGRMTPLATLPIPNVFEVAFNPGGTELYIRRVGDVQVWGVAPAS